jgi:O-succinylbenzoic acid--CoA ligase
VHELRVVDASDVDAVMTALRAALNGGPALLPKDFRAVRGASSHESALLTEVAASVSVVIETSGSTGTPKRVGLSNAALTASGHAAHDRLGGPGQWLLALPLTYIAGISVLVRSLLAETEPVVLPSGHFDPSYFIEHVLQMTDARRYTSLVPVQLARLVEYAEDKESARSAIGRLDAILIGGQALDPALASRAQGLGWNVVATYGSSETAGGCVYDGIALAGVIAKIGDPITREVWVSGATVAEGYLGDDGQTAARFVVTNDTRWYRTGDAGDLTDGVLSVTGRLDRVLISGGLKISLEAVESAARTVVGGESTVAASIPDSEWGQRPALVVAGTVGAPEREALEDALYEAVVSALGRAAAPRLIRHVSAIPRLTNGKVDLVAISQILHEADE